MSPYAPPLKSRSEAHDAMYSVALLGVPLPLRARDLLSSSLLTRLTNCEISGIPIACITMEFSTTRRPHP